MATASATATQALSSTDEKDSYQRLSRLIMRAGTEVLRALFDSFYPPNSLANKLSESATKKDLCKALLKPQRMLVYPAQGLFGKSKDFDISLLTQLLKTLCQTKLPPLDSGWDCLPSTSNLTLTADIVRIKLYRNDFIHKYYYGELNDAEFRFLWDEIKKALLRIASYISAETKLEWEEAINRLRHDPLTPEAARDAEELMEVYQKEMILNECVLSGFARVERLIRVSSEETNERLDEMNNEIGRLRELVTDRAQSSSAVEGGADLPISISLEEAPTTTISSHVQPTASVDEPLTITADRSIADRFTQRIALEIRRHYDSSTAEENGFVQHLEDVNQVPIVDVNPGSLVLTVRCSSLEILERLWQDYSSDHLGKVAQEFLVTERVLEDLGLVELKLKITIPEKDYWEVRWHFPECAGSDYSEETEGGQKEDGKEEEYIPSQHPTGSNYSEETEGGQKEDGKEEEYILSQHPTETQKLKTLKTLLVAHPFRWWRSDKFVGAGAFSKVYECHFSSENYEGLCAVKIVKIEPQSQTAVEMLLNEIDILKDIRHHRVVAYYGSEERDNHLHLFIELMKGGSLSDRILEKGVLSERESRKYAKQMLEGVSFLHSKNIVHRDIKGSNVLLDEDGNVKLADFRLSTIIQKIGSDTNPLSFCGTPFWMAPEIFREEGYGRKVDIWSVGCTVVEMLTGRPPLGDLEPEAAMFRIASKPTVPKLPEDTSKSMKDLITAALTWNPKDRPGSNDLLEKFFESAVRNPFGMARRPDPPPGTSIQESNPGTLEASGGSSKLVEETLAGICRKLSLLPRTVPHFVNRETECDKIREYLSPLNDCRCLLIHGATGMGKTTVAIKVANDILNSDGRTVVIYVNCRNIQLFDDFAKEVLRQVYHYPVENPIAELKNRLKSQDFYTILLLDNFEFLLHLDDRMQLPENELSLQQMNPSEEGSRIKKLINEILMVTDNIKLLLTSSEKVCFPESGREMVHLSPFKPEESVKLLKRVWKDRQVNITQAHDLSEICRGIPLVLYTLASSHSNLPSLLEAMRGPSPPKKFDFFRKIQTVSVDMKINVCIDHCFERLDLIEKHVLIRFALLKRRFSLSEAVKIFQSTEMSASQLRRCGLELSKRSLLEERIDGDECSYTLLRVIRDYCETKAMEQEFLQVILDARRMFIRHFLTLLEDIFKMFLSQNVSEAIAAFQKDEANVMQLVEWCKNGQMDEEQTRRCIDVFNSVTELLAKMMGKAKFEYAFKSLRKRCEEMKDQTRLSDCLTSLGLKEVFSYSCPSIGPCALHAEIAKEYFTKADRIQRNLGVKKGNSRAQCLAKLGRCIATVGFFEEAKEKVQQAIRIRSEGQDDDVMLGATYNDLGVILSLEGNHEQAIKVRERKTLPIYRRTLGKHPFTATVLNSLSNNYFAQGEYNVAEQYSKKALEIRLELLKDHRDTAKSLFDLAMVHKMKEEFKSAEEYLERCEAMQKKILDDENNDLTRTRKELKEVIGHLLGAMQGNS